MPVACHPPAREANMILTYWSVMQFSMAMRPISTFIHVIDREPIKTGLSPLYVTEVVLTCFVSHSPCSVVSLQTSSESLVWLRLVVCPVCWRYFEPHLLIPPQGKGSCRESKQSVLHSRWVCVRTRPVQTATGWHVHMRKVRCWLQAAINSSTTPAGLMLHIVCVCVRLWVRVQVSLPSLLLVAPPFGPEYYFH